MTPINVICFECKNYVSDGICKAFPDGIPIEIINGVNDHSKPLPEQGNDIAFESINENS